MSRSLGKGNEPVLVPTEPLALPCVSMGQQGAAAYHSGGPTGLPNNPAPTPATEFGSGFGSRFFPKPQIDKERRLCPPQPLERVSDPPVGPPFDLDAMPWWGNMGNGTNFEKIPA